MTHTCAICGATTDDPVGWARVQMTFTHYVRGADTSGMPLVTPDDAIVVLDFDTDVCRDAWSARTEVHA